MIKLFKRYYPIRNIIFVFTESIFIFLSIFTAVMLFDPGVNAAGKGYIFYNTLLITLICQVCIYYTNLYEINIYNSLKALGVRLFMALIIASTFLGLLYMVLPGLIIKPEIFAIGVTIMVIMIGSTRFLYFWILKRGFFNQRIIIIGESDLSKQIINEIEERTDCGYQASYIVLDKDDSFNTKIPVIQKPDYSDLCDLAKKMGIKTIVVAIKEKRGNFPSKELLRCRIEGIDILEGNSFYEMLSGKLVVNQLYPSWLIFSSGFKKSLTKGFFKRIFDIVLSLLMLIISLPLMILVAILIKIESKGPVFYSQERVGQNHKKYYIHKFRSMVDNAEETCGPQYACENDHRITRIGHYLRKLRIDELPQLWNVLKGQMSFVGPRPERSVFVEEYEKEIPYYVERFSVKPGITGWAQICYQYGANTEDTIEKLNYDLFYIKNMSVLMDIMIVLRTIKIVLFGTGAR